MNVFKILVCVYFGCWLLNVIPFVNGFASIVPQCIDCENRLLNCNISKDLITSDEEDQIVALEPDEKPDPRYENCILPGKKLTSTFKGTVCSATKTGECGVISFPSSLKVLDLVRCKACARACKCTYKAGRASMIKTNSKLLIYLGVFYIVMHIKN